ncbi:MAG: Wzz/FepE/Etk N-terminal domain-containing protein [Anaerolineae bacterium]
MELSHLLRALRRRWWLILAFVAVTALVLGIRLRSAPNMYEAQARLQLTAPPQEDVSVFPQNRASSLRDEMTIARNNLVELLKSREIDSRAAKRLNLATLDTAYSLDVSPVRDSDFLYVTVRAASPTQAADIANALATEAIAYYGEIRAKPSVATKSLLDDQVRAAEKSYRDAEDAFTAFRLENRLSTLDQELATSQQLLQQGLLGQDKATLAGVSTSSADDLVARRQADVKRLVTLQPQYALLQGKLAAAYDNYQLLLKKQSEAGVTESQARTVAYIQVIEPAVAPAQPVVARTGVLFGLTLLGSLGLGVVLALLLEAGLRDRRPVAPTLPSIGQ